MAFDLMESRRRILLNTPHVGSASGGIATFSTDMAAPLKSCVVTVEPVQSGSGDPSPDNVRPISGWTGCNVYVRGINLWDGSWENGNISDSTGNNSGTSSSYWRSTGYIPFPTAVQYYMYSPFRSGNFRQFYYDKDKVYLGYHGLAWNRVINSGDKSYANRIRYLRFRIAQSHDDRDNQASVNYPSSYHNSYIYAGDSNTISWETEAGTVYGAELDAITGLLTVRPYYASYNGETLVGPWISSMDVYAAGTTPTTGAQVVDWGGIADTYQLTPQQVSTLKGVNNIWADCGPVDIKYWKH